MFYLKEVVNQGQKTHEVNITETLPSFIIGPCHLKVCFSVEAKDDFYLMNMETTGDLNLVCQRCMQEYIFPYANQLVLAVCRTDEQAEKLLDHYETIVSPNLSVNLPELIRDELFLYVPQMHSEIEDCGIEINEVLKGKIETS